MSLAYVEHNGYSARAVISLAGHGFILPQCESNELFQWLLNPGGRTQVVLCVAKGLLTGWRDQQVSGGILFNTGHSGLERGDYPAMLKRMRVIRSLWCTI